MAIELENIRAHLLPGLWEMRGSYDAIPAQWAMIFSAADDELWTTITLPTVSIPVAIAAGAAAEVIRNPEVTRRWLFGGGT
jgi:hypothetical protein